MVLRLCGTLSAVMMLLPAADAGDSLASRVPADVGLFIEVRDGGDLLTPLTEPQIWITLAELAGQPAQVEDAAEWRKRIRETVKMDPTDAIRTLFSQRVAFVGDAPGRAQDAAVLCSLPANTQPADLLTSWKAQPRPTAGTPEVYLLRNNIGLTVQDRMLTFGDPSVNGGMFDRLLKLAEGGGAAALSDDETFRKLLSRVPDKPDGVLFARMGRAGRLPLPTPTSQPASQPRPAVLETAIPELPGPLRGASNVLFALHRQGDMLHFTAVGDADVRPRRGMAALTPLVARLPARTYLAWAGHVDYSALMAGLETLPRSSIVYLAAQIHRRQGTTDELLAALDSSTCIALGSVNPPSRTVTAPPVPAVAVLVAVRDAATVERRFGELLKTSASIYNLLSLKLGLPPLPEMRGVRVAGVSAQLLDMSALIARVDGGAIGELHLCWALDDDVLIVASHSDWLKQILESRHGTRADASAVMHLTRRPISPDSETILFAQTGPIADLGGHWLDFLQRHSPRVLDEDWWRDKQPGGANVRLGITVTEDSENKRLRVNTVGAKAPASGVLRPDDQIVGCTRQRFATTQPIREIQTAIESRPDARRVDLIIERDGQARLARVPVPFVDPVETLRRLIAIGKIAQRVVYYDDVPDAAGPRGFLTVELRRGAKPLFAVAPQPVVQPTGGDDSRP